MLHFPMNPHLTCRHLISLGLMLLLAPTFAKGENLSDVPAIIFQVSTQPVDLIRLSDFGAHEVVATKKIALINDGRNICFFRGNKNTLEKKAFADLPREANWYGPVCAMGERFVIAVQDYPEEQLEKDSNAPRGSFVEGPTSPGFVLLSPAKADRYVPSLTVVSRPPQDFTPNTEDPENALFSDDVQSCAWDGTSLFIGSYGSVGKTNFAAGTIDLIEEDSEQTLSHLPLFIEKQALWFGLDEGGLGGASLVMRPFHGETKNFFIANSEDIVSFSALTRHEGRLITGTSHGLFQLDERSGHFQRLEFGEKYSGSRVTTLLSHKGFLWAFIGGEWLRIDLKKRKAVRYVHSTPTELTTGTPFRRSWLLAGPNGVWKIHSNPLKQR
ncbi:MAG: hypothetical protein WCT30_01715 [Desulfurivibrionaceae bacterium]|jgi:hypothetical protein